MTLLRRIWALIKLVKAGSYDKMVDAVLPLVLENKTVAPFLAKNKTVIGFILLIVYQGLEVAAATFPGQAWIQPAILVLGVILTALGIAHRGVKERAAQQ